MVHAPVSLEVKRKGIRINFEIINQFQVLPVSQHPKERLLFPSTLRHPPPRSSKSVRQAGPDKHTHSILEGVSGNSFNIASHFQDFFFLGWRLRQLSFCIVWQHKTKQSPAGPNDQKLKKKAGRSSRWRVMRNRPQFIQPLKHPDPVSAIVQVTEICMALFSFVFVFPHVFSSQVQCIC